MTNLSEIGDFLNCLDLRFIEPRASVPDDGIPTFSPPPGRVLEFVELPDGTETVSGDVVARNKAAEHWLELHQIAVEMQCGQSTNGLRAWYLMESLKSRGLVCLNLESASALAVA